MRDAWGKTLVCAGRANTPSSRAGRRPGELDPGRHLCRTPYPDRFFEMGIAEQNMLGVAAGLATLRLRAVDQHLRRLPDLAARWTRSGWWSPSRT